MHQHVQQQFRKIDCVGAQPTDGFRNLEFCIQPFSWSTSRPQFIFICFDVLDDVPAFMGTPVNLRVAHHRRCGREFHAVVGKYRGAGSRLEASGKKTHAARNRKH